MCNIAIIGCGVIGLSTAVEIQKEIRGAKITIFTEDVSPNTTGDVSAGFWTPYLLQDTPKEDVIKWSKATHNYMLHLWKSGLAEEAGISLIPAMMLYAKELSTPPTLSEIAFGFQLLDKAHLQKLSKEHGKEYAYGYSFVTFTMEPVKYLPMLQKSFLKNGGEIVMKKIKNLEELSDYDAIVNCSGLSCKTLVGDERMKPMRGQVARVSAPWQFHVIQGDADGSYIIPNMECVVLGGTSQPENDLTVRSCDKDLILKNCFNMVPALENASIIKHQVGLRPGRNRVRVEFELRKVGSKMMKVVHNYGHGGSGVTLSHGCAEEACSLLKEALNAKNKL